MEELDAIRERIKKHRLSFVWLIFQLGQRGIATDKTEVSSIFAGTRKGAKADSIGYWINAAVQTASLTRSARLYWAKTYGLM